MAYSPISSIVPQYCKATTGLPYSGAVLKAYSAGTTTNISMATSSAGSTTFTSIALNSNGNPSHNGSVIIPYVNENYKLALYADQDDADADTNAIWSVDNLIPPITSGSYSVTDANNNTVVDVITLTHATTGTPTTGIGAGLAFAVEGTDDTMTCMTIDAVSTDVGSASEDYDFVLSLTKAGAAPAQVMRVSSLGNVTLSNDVLFSVANPEILGGDADGVLYLAPSTTNALGGNILLYGDTHATKAKDIELRATAGVEAHYDDSASTWDFQANALTTTGNITGAIGTFSGGIVSGSAALAEAELELLDGITAGTMAASKCLVADASAQILLVGTRETVYTISDGAGFTIDPVNGNIQTITLGAARTPVWGGSNGEGCVLMINDGTAYAITWTDSSFNSGAGPTWLNNGAAAPTLATSGYTAVYLFEVAGIEYGLVLGDQS